MLKKYNITDFFVLLLIVFTLAFHNYKYPLAAIQIISSAWIFINSLRFGGFPRQKITYLAWGFGFFILSLISCFWSTSVDLAISSVLSTIQIFMVGTAIILYMDSSKKINYVMCFVIISSLVLCLRLVVEAPIEAWGNERISNYIGYGNNSASNILAYTSLVTFFMFHRISKRKMKLVFIILTFIFILMALMCGSKKAILISIIGIGLQFILYSKNRYVLFKRLIITGIITFLLLVIIMNFEPLYNVLGRRVEQMFLAFENEGEGDYSTKDRIQFTYRAIEVFKEHPLIGVGIDNFRLFNSNNYYAHNNFVEILADLGVIGFIAYYWFFVYLILSIFKLEKNRNKIFLLTIVVLILFMDVANVSYCTDSIQLFIAISYGVLIIDKKQCINAFLGEENYNDDSIIYYETGEKNYAVSNYKKI